MMVCVSLTLMFPRQPGPSLCWEYRSQSQAHAWKHLGTPDMCVGLRGGSLSSCPALALMHRVARVRRYEGYYFDPSKIFPDGR